MAALLNGAHIRGRTLTARRVPNTGAMVGGGWGGDVLVGERCDACVKGGPLDRCAVCISAGEKRFEVKRRATLPKTVSGWLEGNHAVCLREDRGDWIIVMRLKDWAETR